jgi:hypothetical protein
MGYTTEFSGSFEITPALTPEQVAYLQAFNETRRMGRDARKLKSFADPKRKAVKLPLGPQGAYFVGSEGDFGQNRDASILDYNKPPEGQPGLWCQWTVSDDGTEIRWDEGEKFYYYTEWLTYIVEHFLQPWGRKIEGEVQWHGEDYDDHGTIYANQIEAQTILERIAIA